MRTLLLEGNQLTDLPPQLGRLRHLTGLNIAHNPLVTPPRHIIDKGTKVLLCHICSIAVVTNSSHMCSQAVLKYLQECLSEAEEGEQQHSSDSTAPQGLSKQTVPLHPIDNRFSLVASTVIILLLFIVNSLVVYL